MSSNKIDVNEHKALLMTARPIDEKTFGKVLIVVSSPIASPVTGKQVGFYLGELCNPMFVFENAGFDVEIASTHGGKVVFDEHSNPLKSDLAKYEMIARGYLTMPEFLAKLEKTKAVADCKESDYVAIFLAGGQGATTTFHNNPALEKLFAQFLEAGKVASTVCHGGVLLLTAKDSKGQLLCHGKAWTSFTDDEERAVEAMSGGKQQELWIETEARKIPGTIWVGTEAFQQHAIRDKNLVTGQNQNSAIFTAQLVVEALHKSRVRLFTH